jgi:hypothetical protein
LQLNLTRWWQGLCCMLVVAVILCMG